uniref:Uncharacterized protein n=1 Tax=Eptatretus burgeri TaxID=7764 RepID=A0A8C4QVH3_EPTBU
MGKKDQKKKKGKGEKLSLWKRVRNFFQKSKQTKVPETCDGPSKYELLQQVNQSLQAKVEELEREKDVLAEQHKETHERLHAQQRFSEKVSSQLEKNMEVAKCREHQLILANERIVEYVTDYEMAQEKIRIINVQLDNVNEHIQAKDVMLDTAKQQIQNLMKNVEDIDMEVAHKESVNRSWQTQVDELNKFIQLLEDQNKLMVFNIQQQSKKLNKLSQRLKSKTRNKKDTVITIPEFVSIF